MKLYYVERADQKDPEKLVVFAYIAHNLAHLDELMGKKFSAWRVVNAESGYPLNKDWGAFYGS